MWTPLKSFTKTVFKSNLCLAKNFQHVHLNQLKCIKQDDLVLICSKKEHLSPTSSYNNHFFLRAEFPFLKLHTLHPKLIWSMEVIHLHHNHLSNIIEDTTLWANSIKPCTAAIISARNIEISWQVSRQVNHQLVQTQQ